MPTDFDANTLPVGAIRSNRYFAIWDAGKPEYQAKLGDRFGIQFATGWNLLALMGREEPISANGLHYAYEENRYKQTIVVRANVADPGAGNPTTFFLAASSIDVLGNHFGREGEVITMPVTGVQAWISDIAGVAPNISFTIMPVDDTQNIGALTANMELAITTNAHAAGTNQPKGVVKGYTKRTFDLQILKEAWSMEGSEVAKQMWFEVFSPEGKSMGYSPITEATIDAQRRINNAMSGMFYYGHMANNAAMTQTTPQGVTNRVTSTKGLIPTISTLGQTVNIAAGALVVDDFDDIQLYMRTQGVSTNIYIHLMGANRFVETENACKAYLQGNGTDLTAAARSVVSGADAESKALAIGFREIYKGQSHNLLKVVDDWSDPTGVGAPGYNYNYYDLIFPLTEKQDPVTGKKLPNLNMRYVEKNGYSRKFEYWTLKGAGGNPSDYNIETDEIKGNYRCHIGFDITSANQMMKINP